MNTDRPPSHEELVDLAWLLDSAVVVGNCDRAIEFADRLQESLLRHQQAVFPANPDGGRAATSTRRQACLTLRADLTSLLSRLRRGELGSGAHFRHRVQWLVDDDNVARHQRSCISALAGDELLPLGGGGLPASSATPA